MTWELSGAINLRAVQAPPSIPLPSPPGRVLIVRMSHLGDIAQTLPLLHAVKAAWPGATIAWAIQPEFAGLVEPLVERVVHFDRRGGLGAWPRLRRALRDFGADLAIDAQGNWKSAIATRLSGAPLRVTLPRSVRQEPLAARFLGLEEIPADQGVASHLVPLCTELGARLTGGAADRIDPDLSGEERAAASRTWSRLSSGAGAVVLHPGAPGDPRSWPAARYRRLAELLIERGTPVVVLTGPAEADVGARLEAEVPGAAHHVGQRGLREFAAFLDAARSRGAVLVGGDSGPAHVAASVGLPVHLIAGPEDPSRTGPWPPRGGSNVVVEDPGRDRPWAGRSVEDVSVDDVLRSLTRRSSS